MKKVTLIEPACRALPFLHEDQQDWQIESTRSPCLASCLSRHSTAAAAGQCCHHLPVLSSNCHRRTPSNICLPRCTDIRWNWGLWMTVNSHFPLMEQANPDCLVWSRKEWRTHALGNQGRMTVTSLYAQRKARHNIRLWQVPSQFQPSVSRL